MKFGVGWKSIAIANRIVQVRHSQFRIEIFHYTRIARLFFMPETIPPPTKPDVDPKPAKPRPAPKPAPFAPDWPQDRPLPQPKGGLGLAIVEVQ